MIPESAKYKRAWLRCHASEIRALCLEFGITPAFLITDHERPASQRTGPFLAVARLLVGTELSYREIVDAARKDGFDHASVNVARTAASRLRNWCGVGFAPRNDDPLDFVERRYRTKGKNLNPHRRRIDPRRRQVDLVEWRYKGKKKPRLF